MPQIVSGLTLADKSDTLAGHTGSAWKARGFEAQRVVLRSTEPFDYEVTGDMHYLALHDVRLDDGEVELDGASGSTLRDLRDRITFAPAGCRISGWSKPAKRANTFTALSFDPGLLHAEVGQRYEAAEPPPQLYIRCDRLHATLSKLGASVSVEMPDPLEAETLALLAAIEALAITPPANKGSLSNARLSKVTDYIQSHAPERPSLDELAQVAGLSRFHFGRAFKSATGQSPYAFVLATRVGIAGELMAKGELSAEEAAVAAGFRCLSDLHRACRRPK